MNRIGATQASMVGAMALSVVGAMGASRVGAIGASLVGAIGASRVGAIRHLLVGAITLSRVGAIGASLVGAMRLSLVGAIRRSVVGAIGASVVGAIAVSSRGASAHHSVLAFDGASATMIRGTVVRILWQDPHALIAVDVDAVRWTIESEGATVLRRLGWTRDLPRTGDTIFVTGARAKDGRRLMRCTTITIHDRQLPCFGSPS